LQMALQCDRILNVYSYIRHWLAIKLVGMMLYFII
jgi:hypothetical protein